VHDTACFCCQQTAEKYLKALLQELGLPVPRTHDVEEVLDLLLPSHHHLRSLRRGCKFLIQFAVNTRYPGECASKRQAIAALRWAGRIRETARALLGISK
jgi:HEPN domain-containing protein